MSGGGCGIGFSYKECEMNRTGYAAIGLLFLFAGLFSVWGVTGREKTGPLAEASAGFAVAVVCLVMAFKKESGTQLKARPPANEEEQQPDIDAGSVAHQSTAEPAQPSKEARAKEVAEGDRSPTHGAYSEEPPWLSWFIWGGILGLVVGVVGGASAGASLVGRWGGSGVLALIGAVVGAIIGAPVGVVLGWIIGAIVVEIIVPLLCTIPLLIALVLKRLWETRR
jgi:hypothetical protein